MFSSNSTPFTMPVQPCNGDGFGDSFGGNSWAWLIILIILFGGYGYGNHGVFGGSGSTGSGITDGYILTSDFANIERKIDGVNTGLCDGFYAMNTGMLNGFAGITNQITQGTISDLQNTNAINAGITALGNQLQSCCCDQRYESATQFAQLNYNLADQSCQTRRTIEDAARDITSNQDNNTRSILSAIQNMQTQALQDKIATLTADNQSLKFAASQVAQNNYLVHALNPTPVPAYTVPNPNVAMYNNCGCNC